MSVRPIVVLAVLFAGAFVMGSAEMLVVGLLDLMAADFGTTPARIGHLVTANALGLAVGGPLCTFLTARWDRRPVLLAATAVFVVLNVVAVAGAGLGVFVAARAVIGAAQGLFIAAALTTATAVVPIHRSGRAMAVVISGFATSSALGLPLGTLLGQAVGWRGAFVAVIGLGLAVLVLAVLVLPSIAPAGAGLRGQARAALAPGVLAVLGVGAVMFVGIQSVLTYLAPLSAGLTGVTGAALTVLLLGYGVSTTLGSAAGGRFADADAPRTMIIGTAGVTTFLLLLFLFGDRWPVMLVGIIGIGLCGMGIAPSLQHRVTELAGPGAALAASFPSSAVNAGIALGSLLGGLALELGGLRLPLLVGTGAAAVAVLLAALTARLRPIPSSGSAGPDRLGIIISTDPR